MPNVVSSSELNEEAAFVSSSAIIGGNDREPVCFDDPERLGELQSPKVIKQRLLEVDNDTNLSLEIILNI